MTYAFSNTSSTFICVKNVPACLEWSRFEKCHFLVVYNFDVNTRILHQSWSVKKVLLEMFFSLLRQMKYPPLLVVTSNIANNALPVNKSLQMTDIKLSVHDTST